MSTIARLFAGGVAVGFAGALSAGAAAQQQELAPDFSSNQTGWISLGNEFIQPPGAGPAIVRNDPAHPFVPNGTAAQPSYRIADLRNPNLKPWVKERMKKDNEESSPARSDLRRVRAAGRWAFRAL